MIIAMMTTSGSGHLETRTRAATPTAATATITPAVGDLADAAVATTGTANDAAAASSERSGVRRLRVTLVNCRAIRREWCLLDAVRRFDDAHGLCDEL